MFLPCPLFNVIGCSLMSLTKPAPSSWSWNVAQGTPFVWLPGWLHAALPHYRVTKHSSALNLADLLSELDISVLTFSTSHPRPSASACAACSSHLFMAWCTQELRRKHRPHFLSLSFEVRTAPSVVLRCVSISRHPSTESLALPAPCTILPVLHWCPSLLLRLLVSVLLTLPTPYSLFLTQKVERVWKSWATVYCSHAQNPSV